jgi:hypothetical protein
MLFGSAVQVCGLGRRCCGNTPFVDIVIWFQNYTSVGCTSVLFLPRRSPFQFCFNFQRRKSHESNIQQLTLSLTRSKNSILFRQEHVQTSSILHAPLQTAIPVQFKIGSLEYNGVILYKVINKRYLYTVVDAGGAVEKAYLLRASDLIGEAA